MQLRKKVNSMKVTISDVARLAGVSTATVSHTINNTRYVSDETKERVYQAIRELGYTPDASARSFRTGKSRRWASLCRTSPTSSSAP